MTFSVSPLIDTDFSLASICHFVSWWTSVVSRGSAWTGKIYDVRPSAAATLRPRALRVFSRPSVAAFQTPAPAVFGNTFCLHFSRISAVSLPLRLIFHIRLPLRCQLLGMQLKECCIFIWCLCRQRESVWGGSVEGGKRKRNGGGGTRLIRSGGTWRDKLRAVLLFESDKWRQKTSLWGAYRSRMCPGTEGGALPRDVVRGQISAYAWNASKMSLTPVLKCGFEGSRRESVLGWEAVFSQLPSVVLVVVVGARLHFLMCGGGPTIELCTRQSCSPKALPVAKGKNTCSAWTINSGLMRMMIVLAIENLQLRNVTDMKTMGVIQFVASCLQK